MPTLRSAALLALLLAAGAPRLQASPTLPPPLPPGAPNQPVASLDLERYAGRWYEVARLPQFFQRRCTGETTATYTRLADGRIEVLNRCATEGMPLEARGIARPAGGGGALEVSFLPGWLSWLPAWGAYWVIDLDPAYQWAVVGGPKRKALWILSRSPDIDPALLERLRQRSEARGYALDELIVAPRPGAGGNATSARGSVPAPKA